MKKLLIAVIVLAILAGGGYYLYRHNQAKAPSDGYNEYQNQAPGDNSQSGQSQTTPTGQTTSINNSTTPDYTPPASPTGGETPPANIQVAEIDFDGTQFSPSSVNIKVNDWVFFKNKSTVDFWPASNPHPTHTDYPGFDALMPIAPGGEYKFQFTKVGSWGFHDHLDHTIGGTVNVSN